MDGEHVSHTMPKRRALPRPFATMAAGGILVSDHAHAASSAKTLMYQGPTVDAWWGTVWVRVPSSWPGAMPRQVAVSREIAAKAMK